MSYRIGKLLQQAVYNNTKIN